MLMEPHSQPVQTTKCIYIILFVRWMYVLYEFMSTMDMDMDMNDVVVRLYAVGA